MKSWDNKFFVKPLLHKQQKMSRKWQLQRLKFLKAIAAIQYNFKIECRLGHIVICWCSFACNNLSQNHLNSVPEHRATKETDHSCICCWSELTLSPSPPSVTEKSPRSSQQFSPCQTTGWGYFFPGTTAVPGVAAAPTGKEGGGGRQGESRLGRRRRRSSCWLSIWARFLLEEGRKEVAKASSTKMVLKWSVV